jgi:hypothetical protein
MRFPTASAAVEQRHCFLEDLLQSAGQSTGLISKDKRDKKCLLSNEIVRLGTGLSHLFPSRLCAVSSRAAPHGQNKKPRSLRGAVPLTAESELTSSRSSGA